MKETTTQRRPIASTLRAMKVGDVEIFPIEQYYTVRNTLYNTMIADTFSGMRYSVESVRNDGAPYTKVTRTA